MLTTPQRLWFWLWVWALILSKHLGVFQTQKWRYRKRSFQNEGGGFYLEKRNSKVASGTRFLFFLHHFVSVCRMVTRVGALESPDIGGHCRYLKHVDLTSRKFFRDVWSRKLHFFLNSMKNGSKSKTSQIGKIDFWGQNVFFSLKFFEIVLQSWDNNWVTSELSETLSDVSGPI